MLRSHLRLPQPGGPSPVFISPLDQGGSVTLPGIGFHFRRLLRIAGLRALQVQV
jgi:hypothetical protein